MPPWLFGGTQPLALGSVWRLRAQLALGVAEDVRFTTIPNLLAAVGAKVNIGVWRSRPAAVEAVDDKRAGYYIGGAAFVVCVRWPTAPKDAAWPKPRRPSRATT